MAATNRQQQQQRLLHVGSAFVAITIVIVFFILGGGNEEGVQATTEQEKGLNIELPDPNSAQLTTNKLELIDKEKKRLMEERSSQRKQNNSFDLMGNLSTPAEDTIKEDLMSKKVEKKIDINTLTENSSIQKPEGMVISSTEENKRSTSVGVKAKTKKEHKEEEYAARAEQRRQKMEEEKRQLRIRYGLEAQEEEKKEEKIAEEESFAESATQKRKGFKTMGSKSNGTDANTIRAVVHGEQKNITTASQIKLRLLDQTSIDGVEIPRNTIVYGKAAFSENRMTITIDNIRYGSNLLPFKAEIYDMDGFRGLYVPDNITNEAKKDASSGAISRTSITAGPSSVSPTGLINTAINATSSAIQSASQKKVKEVKVDLPANYKLLIKKKGK